MSEPGHVTTLERLAHVARHIAIAGAEAAIAAVIKDLMSLVDDEDDVRMAGVLSQDPQHAGTPARPIDALAQAAARDGAEAKWNELRQGISDKAGHISYIGEESGTQTQLVYPGTLIVRFDPLDGTTNAVNMLTAFGSVATVDILLEADASPRHLAGAIIGGEIDVSWSHWSRRPRGAKAYPRPLGKVLVRSTRLDTDWRRLEVSQDERDVSSVASVAASQKRFMDFAPFRDRAFANKGVVYHLAGNPLCAALLLGQVGAFVETQQVTLHDSAFLIPHWLLGGQIETLNFERLDYLLEYERNALNFDPKAKPIPPFIAFVGESNPFRDQAAGSAVDPAGSKDPPSSGERLFRPIT